MIIRQFGLQPYPIIWENMKDFTNRRHSDTPDEVWLLEHLPIYTQGQAGKAEHILDAKGIPVIQTDRGGQVTYHGPGQLVAYFLFDIQRQDIGVRTLVCHLEQLLIYTLKNFSIEAHCISGAPGIYVENQNSCFKNFII